jgi:uncharacterized protein YdhG (YjbR/CyaY superfamily)
MKKQPPATVDDYVAGYPRPVQRILKEVRRTIRKTLGGAEEVISYQMPAYRLNGRVVIYFAAWKDHYSLYPLNRALEQAFKTEIARYEISGKGTIRFPFSEPVPTALIANIATFRANEVAERAQAAKRGRVRRASRQRVGASGSRPR